MAIDWSRVLTFAQTMKRFLGLLLVLLSASGSPAASTPPPRATIFVFAKIQDNVSPTERGEKYEDPLGSALIQAKLGEVTGGGSMLNKDGSVDWIGIDIELVDLSAAVTFTKQKLRELGAPKGSILEFKRNGKDVVERIHDD
jgi:hypothetical protein